jgi:23S rRNA (adenine-N6)-dimethyltransferase
MAKKHDRRSLYAQNFLRSKKLARKLISLSSISSQEIVYEIGPGEGILTSELAKTARSVIAIEIDTQLVNKLETTFKNNFKVRINQGNFLKYRLPESEFTIFANIPFNITSAIVRKLFFGERPPSKAFLVMQKEAANKFLGIPHETQFSVMMKPFWELEIIYQFRKGDFIPEPKVIPVFLKVVKRLNPLIEVRDIQIYRRFVTYGFGSWKKNLKLGFKQIFTYKQWKRLAKEYGFPIESSPTELTLEQWIGLFICFKERVPDIKKERIYQ